MKLVDVQAGSLVGWKVIPCITELRAQFHRRMGIAAGDRAADALPLRGWLVVFDMREDGCADGFVCQHADPDGSVRSVVWDADEIQAFFPVPRLV